MSAAAANALLNTWASTYHWISLHTADPGNTGANEIVGGTYVRQLVAWPAAVSHIIDWVGLLTFQIPGPMTVSWWGVWSAQTGGTWGDGQVLGVARTFAAPNTCGLSRLTFALIG